MNQSVKKNEIQISSIEILSRPSLTKDRINEDAWLVWETPGYLGPTTVAVIDGAGMRLPFKALINELQKLWPSLSPAAFASSTVKKSILKQLQQEPDRSLREILVNANEYLRQAINQVAGKYDVAQILSEFGDPWTNDLRHVRLLMPACAVTLARFDLEKREVSFAHLGDTSLFELRNDGKTVRHTADQMGKFDQAAFEAILEYQQREKFPNFKDAVMSPGGRRFIIESGLHLNYVDEQGRTDPTQGCGILNGLSEVSDYIETGTTEIDPSRAGAFVLMTDGLEMLQPLQESDLQEENRLNLMGSMVKRGGLVELYEAMNKMAEEDVYFDTYPRTKIRDDATGIYLQISNR